jgi:RNA polymerase sigma factor (TIGR02999 family)
MHGEITALLARLRNGDRDAGSRLIQLTYRDLQRLAGYFLRKEASGHILQPTALVHEAYLRLMTENKPVWKDRKHFIAAAAYAMRNILTDYARSQNARKRGGPHLQEIPLEEVRLPVYASPWLSIAIHEALQQLAQFDIQMYCVVKLRFFAELTVKETAEALAISPATVKREIQIAKAWLYGRLQNRSFTKCKKNFVERCPAKNPLL